MDSRAEKENWDFREEICTDYHEREVLFAKRIFSHEIEGKDKARELVLRKDDF